MTKTLSLQLVCNNIKLCIYLNCHLLFVKYINCNVKNSENVEKQRKQLFIYIPQSYN